MNNPVTSYGELAHKRTVSSVTASSAQQSRGGQSNLKNKRLLHFIRNSRGYMFHGQNSYNFMNGFIFISPFQNEKDLNGLPKIALRKSESLLSSRRKVLTERSNSLRKISRIRSIRRRFWAALIFASLYLC